MLFPRVYEICKLSSFLKGLQLCLVTVWALNYSGFALAMPVKSEVIPDLDSPVQLAMQSGEEISLQLLAKEGSLVHLSMTFDEGRFTVNLVGADGHHVRQLLKDGVGRRHVVFIQPDDEARLMISSLDGGAISFNQTGRIDLENQIAPRPTYESHRIGELARALEKGESTEAFWSRIEAEGTPIVEPLEDGHSIVTFVSRGATHNVKMLGGPTNDIYAFERLGQSDVWFHSVRVPAGALFSYKIAKDIPEFSGPARQRRVAILAKAKADPYNRFPWPADAIDAYNQDSTYRLDGGDLKAWHENKGNPSGDLSHHRLKSNALKNERDVWIYRSAGFDASQPETPLLVVFDGESFRDRGQILTSIDNLVADKQIPPLAVALVSPIDLRIRTKELPDSDGFADLMANELMALVTAETGLSPKPSRTILSGSSFGGLGSTTIALKHPERFGNVLSMSGSYWWSPQGYEVSENYVARQVVNSDVRPIRFFLSAGLFETSRDGNFAGILLPNRHLRDVLLAKGYDVIHREYPAGHDMFAWREILPQGLIALLKK